MSKERMAVTKAKRAQTMTEYLILVCLLAAGSVVIVSQFGNLIRGQISSAAYRIAGKSPPQGQKASEIVQNIDDKVRRGMDDFWKR